MPDPLELRDALEALRIAGQRILGLAEEPVDRREEIVQVVQDAGYRYVTLDLEGFRSGNLNGALRP